MLMIKGDTPRAMMGRSTFFFTLKNSGRIFNRLFFPNKKERAQIQEIPWAMMVAMAAPLTPM